MRFLPRSRSWSLNPELLETRNLASSMPERVRGSLADSTRGTWPFEFRGKRCDTSAHMEKSLLRVLEGNTAHFAPSRLVRIRIPWTYSPTREP